MPQKSKIEEITAEPLGAIGATRWLNMTEFCALYRCDRSRIINLVNAGVLKGFKLGRDWRIYNPGWDIVIAMINPRAYLDDAPILNQTDVAIICGVSQDCVTWWQREGYIKGVRVGRLYHYSINQVKKRNLERQAWYKKRGVSRKFVREYAMKRLKDTIDVDGSGATEDPKSGPAGS